MKILRCLKNRWSSRLAVSLLVVLWSNGAAFAQANFYDDKTIKLRQMYLREVEKVKCGEAPKCIVRDPEKNKMIIIPACEKWVAESERDLGKTAAVG